MCEEKFSPIFPTRITWTGSFVRRGGCGIKTISAKPTLAPQPGWSLTNRILLKRPPRPLRQMRLRDILLGVAATPPHEEGIAPMETVRNLESAIVVTDYRP